MSAGNGREGSLSLYFQNLGQQQARLPCHKLQHRVCRIAGQSQLMQLFPDAYAHLGTIFRRSLVSQRASPPFRGFELGALNTGAMIEG